jgi:hypothetical protein
MVMARVVDPVGRLYLCLLSQPLLGRVRAVQLWTGAPAATAQDEQCCEFTAKVVTFPAEPQASSPS